MPLKLPLKLTNKSDALLLFQKPFEPIFTTRKCGNESVRFDVPSNFLVGEFVNQVVEITQRFGDEADRTVSLKSVGDINLTFADAVRVDGPFSLFIKEHRNIAAELIGMLYDCKTVDIFISTAAYIKDRLNPYLFQYVLAVAISHHPLTKQLDVPPIMMVFPDQFVDPGVFPKIRKEANLVAAGNRSTIIVPINFTATDKEIEQKMAYFREDIGVNSHHWHWHLVYPGDGPTAIVKKDRRGELFYYMHQQMMNRYNITRFCHKLPKTIPLSDLRGQLTEGYFPKIIRSSNNRAYPPRVELYYLTDIDRPDDGVTVQISDVQMWTDRILNAIDLGYATKQNGERVPLNNDRGIDYLGDIVEASSLSINHQYYGDIHNMGHLLIAYIHDCHGRFLEDYSVMGDVATAMRDPLFYRWHGHINNIFLRHKMCLSPYTKQELAFDGITVSSIDTYITREPKVEPNLLLTYWQRSDVDLSAGLDFGPEGNVYAQFTHLQHVGFHYKIIVNNAASTAKKGTCRIFLTSKFDERGTLLTLDQMRELFIEMDKFTVTLNPGANTIVRRSDESTVTIPYARTFRKVGAAQTPTDPKELSEFRFCGCGWPQHMLLPIGNEQGMPFILFAMISNYNDDTIGQDYDQTVNCNEGAAYCGLRDSKYPDKRPMGFPFDKKIVETSLRSFLKPNMTTKEVKIRFTNVVKTT